ncbi:MAG: hypothetical protein A2Y24_02920 [Clostridiales bacterium GWE2_32_10]|nr:MAG: hypothetical protein A2Y24_02920 [Clostridiales bacterium GWE2_32_10]HBY19551.1 hypothetical protein [Clostridiales bacterium]
MEKIIAVVIMVVIVVGLIAVVVMPQGRQVESVGGKAQGQIDSVSTSMGGAGSSEVTSAQVAAEYPLLATDPNTYVAFYNTANAAMSVTTTSTGIGVYLNTGAVAATSLSYGEAVNPANNGLWTNTPAGNNGGIQVTTATASPTITANVVFRRMSVSAKDTTGVPHTFVLYVRK